MNTIILVFFTMTSLLTAYFLLARRLMRRKAGQLIVASERPKIVSILSAPTFFDLTFREALDFHAAPKLIEKKLLKAVNEAAGCASFDPLIVGIKVVDMVRSKDLMLATFPEKVNSLMKQGQVVLMKTKDGQDILMEAVTKDGGALVAHARKVDPTVLSRVSSVGPLVVGAAHIIAGYDNAKKLKLIDKKLDRVLHHQANSMSAELQAIYESAKESFINTNGSDQTHLRYLRLRVKHLRCQWVLQIDSALNEIENPENRSFLTKLFSRNKTTAAAIENQMTAQEEFLYMVRFSVQLEEMIATAQGEREAFIKCAIPEIRSQITSLGEKVKCGRTFIEKLGQVDSKALDNAIRGFREFDASMPRSEEQMQITETGKLAA